MPFHMHLFIAPLLALLHSPYSPATELRKFCAAAMRHAFFHAIANPYFEKTYSSARVGLFARSSDIDVDGSQLQSESSFQTSFEVTSQVWASNKSARR